MATTPLETLKAYRMAYSRLHDFLSDMIEGGRLKEADIPDDYAALVHQLSGPCAAADDHMADALSLAERAFSLLSDSTDAWDGEEDSVKEEKAEHIEELEAFWKDYRAHREPSTKRPSARP